MCIDKTECPSELNQYDPYAPPEAMLARLLRDDLGVTIDPQALRIFIRWRWDRIQKLAHKIHES